MATVWAPKFCRPLARALALRDPAGNRALVASLQRTLDSWSTPGYPGKNEGFGKPRGSCRRTRTLATSFQLRNKGASPWGANEKPDAPRSCPTSTQPSEHFCTQAWIGRGSSLWAPILPLTPGTAPVSPWVRMLRQRDDPRMGHKTGARHKPRECRSEAGCGRCPALPARAQSRIPVTQGPACHAGPKP